MREQPDSGRQQKRLKSLIKRLPVIGPLATALWESIRPAPKFPGTGRYWEQRYSNGGTSGAGSYNQLAAFKAEVINAFVEKQRIGSVIEFGCGDGNQLALARYPRYLGVDVSGTAVDLCRRRFSSDSSKTFTRVDAFTDEKADLALSLDVIYHLVEDPVFDLYMRRLFSASDRFVIVYSSNDELLNEKCGGHHVKHRRFSDWIEANAAGWTLRKHLPNRYPYLESDPDGTSLADFYFFEKTA